MISSRSRLARCWGCNTDHRTTEATAPREMHWLDLCESCMPDYFAGREEGARDEKAHRSDFRRRSMPLVKRKGYMAGRFIGRQRVKRWANTVSATERLLVDEPED